MPGKEKLYPASEKENVFFKNPPVIDVDDEGNVYALENSLNLIYKMDKRGEFLKKIGNTGLGPGDLLRPIFIKIKNNRLYVDDNIGISIFSTEGTFIKKFRLFNQREGFDIIGDNIVIKEFEISKSHLFNIYTSEGKKIRSFGNRYKIDYSILKGFDKETVDFLVNRGKIMCSDKRIYFISFQFGDVFIFDNEGKLTGKEKVNGLDDTSLSFIKRNIDKYFIKGAVRYKDKPNPAVEGDPYVFLDSILQGDMIYVLTSVGKDDILIYGIDTKIWEVKKKYRMGGLKGLNSGFYIAGNKEKNGFYISGQDFEENCIGLYVSKNKKNIN